MSFESPRSLVKFDLHSNAAPIAVPAVVCEAMQSYLDLTGVELACPWPTVLQCGGFDIGTSSGVLAPWRTCTGGRTLDSCWPSVADCTTLWSLSLQSQQLVGTLPAWIASFAGLQKLCVVPV